MATNAFLSPGKSHAFGGCCLNVDDIGRNPASLSKYLLHLRDKRGQPRRLTDEGDVDIDHGESLVPGKLDHLIEEDNRRDVGIFCIGIGKMLADITPSQGSEQGIAQGVGEHVGIGMSS